MKKIPYGMTDFEMIRREDYYYVDKTRFIAEVERAGRYIFLLRPRRFGKSYKLTITFKDEKTLKLRGYIGVEALGETMYWTKIQ